jgi:hypothetical protein
VPGIDCRNLRFVPEFFVFFTHFTKKC